MEVWICHEDTRHGHSLYLAFSKEEKDEHHRLFLKKRWDRTEEGPMPEDLDEADEVISDGNEWFRYELAVIQPSKLLDSRTLGTVLAALRFWQRLGNNHEDPEMDIAADGGIEPLTAEEIDDLCEELNQ